jgi:WD40 repeat protein/uncharacterized caspase-like protein
MRIPTALASLLSSGFVSLAAQAARPPVVQLHSIAVSNDGARVAVGASWGTPPEARVFVADVATGALAIEKSLAQFASALAFSPDGSELALVLSGQPGKVQRIRVPSGEELPAASDFPGFAGYLAYSADGSKLAIAGSEAITIAVFGKESPPPTATLLIWSVGDRRMVQALPLGSLVTARFAPDGRSVLAMLRDGGAKVIDAQSGRELRAVARPTDPSVAEYFAGGVIGTYGPTSVSAIRGGKLERVPAQIDARITTMRLSADATLAWVGGNDGVARAFELATGDEVHSVAPWLSRSAELVPPTSGGGAALSFSADGRRLVAANRTAQVDLWDVTLGRLLRRLDGGGRSIAAVGYKPDGTEVTAGNSIGLLPIFDPTSGARTGVDGQHTEKAITSISYSLDGKRLAFASTDGRTRLHVDKIGSFAPARHLLDNKGEPVLEVAFDTDGATLATRDAKAVKLWNGNTGEYLRALEFPGKPKSICGGGGNIAVGTDKELFVYDLKTNKLHRMSGHDDGFPACALDPKGEQIVVIAGITAWLWPVVEGQPTVKLPGVLLATAVAFAPNAPFIAVADVALGASSERTISIFNRDGTLLRRLEGRAQWQEAVAFQPDGPLLATASFDRILRLWDLSHGRMVKRADLDTIGTPRRIAFSPDGRLVAVGSSRGELALWEIGANKGTKHAFADSPIDSLRFNATGDRVYLNAGGFPFIVDAATLKMIDGVDPLCATGASFDLLDDGTRVLLICGKPGEQTRYTSILLDRFGLGETANRLVVAGPGRRQAIASWKDVKPKKAPTLWELTEQRDRQDKGIDDRRARLAEEGKSILLLSPEEGKSTFSSVGARLLSDEINALAFRPDGKVIAAGFGNKSDGEDSSIRFFDVDTGKAVLGRLAQDSAVRGLAWRPDGKLLAAATAGGSVLLLSPEGALVATLFGLQDEEWAIALPDGRYAASRGAAKELSFRAGNRALPFDQLDLLLHRPDSVIEALALGWKWTTPARIESYRRQRQARLARVGFREDQLGQSYDLPQVRVDRRAIPIKTAERRLTFGINAFSSVRPLERIQVSVNDVPALGRQGLSVREGAPLRVKRDVSLELSAGRNVVQVSAFDSAGSESLRETLEVELTAEAKPALYVLAVGLSKYKEAGRDLAYPVADAVALAKFFQENPGRFARVEVKVLADEKATRDAILAGRALFAQAGPDDTVVVLLAGHGLRSARDEFYFASYDVAFDKPEGRGVPYSEIDAFFDQTRARRRLLLMDACYSGELDAPAAAPAPAIAQADPKDAPGIKLRGVTLRKSRRSAESAATVLESLYADLRRGSGAVVIAAAAGVEQAAERSDLEHGVFTYALLEGMKNPAADTNGDGEVQVSELLRFVQRRVRELSGGAQTPTVNRDNLSVDYGLSWISWKER